MSAVQFTLFPDGKISMGDQVATSTSLGKQLRYSTEVADASGAKNLTRVTASQSPRFLGQRWSAAVYRQTMCCEPASPPGRWDLRTNFLIFKDLGRSRLSDGILTSKVDMICVASVHYHRTLVLRVETHAGQPDLRQSLPLLHTGQHAGPGQWWQQWWLHHDSDLQSQTLTAFNFCPRRGTWNPFRITSHLGRARALTQVRGWAGRLPGGNEPSLGRNGVTLCAAAVPPVSLYTDIWCKFPLEKGSAALEKFANHWSTWSSKVSSKC